MIVPGDGMLLKSGAPGQTNEKNYEDCPAHHFEEISHSGEF
jgi:hypothetical protein